MEAKSDIIKEVYHDHDIGFGSIAQTLKWARMKDPTITYKDVAQWIERNTMRKTNLRGYNSFIASKPREEYQMDLFFMNDFKELIQNDLPVLLMVDTFTKITQVVPIKGKRDEDVMAGMEQCIQKMGGKPETIYTDKEPAVMSSLISVFCKHHNIRLLITETHAGIAERMIRTIKNMMVKRLEHSGKRDWRDPAFLDALCRTYNTRMTHRTTRMTPENAAIPENRFQVKVNLELSRKSQRKYPELHEGDRVRKYEKKKSYAKERHSVWSKDIYTISKEEQSFGQTLYKIAPKPKKEKEWFMRHELLKV
jgi:hypothetical protein